MKSVLNLHWRKRVRVVHVLVFFIVFSVSPSGWVFPTITFGGYQVADFRLFCRLYSAGFKIWVSKMQLSLAYLSTHLSPIDLPACPAYLSTPSRPSYSPLRLIPLPGSLRLLSPLPSSSFLAPFLASFFGSVPHRVFHRRAVANCSNSAVKS